MVTLIVSSPVVARCAESDDIKQFKDRFELLETKLKLAERDIQDLKKEIEILKADKQNDGGADEKDKKVIAPLGTTWKGKLRAGATEGSAEMKVVARDGKTMTLESSVEQGAIWQYDCQFTPADKYKITATRRIQANRGIVNPGPVGGTTGTGTVSKTTLVQNFTLKSGNEPNVDFRFKGDLVADPK